MMNTKQEKCVENQQLDREKAYATKLSLVLGYSPCSLQRVVAARQRLSGQGARLLTG